MFEVLKTATGSKARIGRLTTPHGVIDTPVFMPVGTQASVKALLPEQVASTGARILLANTYHLNLRPGSDLIRDLGGIHKFMGWDGSVLTDSGGFQVFSLAPIRKIRDDGIAFKSHIDGASIFLGPRECFQIQDQLGSDIAMVLDECPPFPCERSACEDAVHRTVQWAAQFKQAAQDSEFFDSGRLAFGIVQGSTFEDLRSRCAQQLVQIGFSGYAIGGVSVGEPEPEMLAQVQATVPHLPSSHPRYVMGVGTPRQLLKMIDMGCDMFDCVMPTRLARHGSVFTDEGVLNLKNERFKRDPEPISRDCSNLCCAKFSRAYLRHLLMSGELLANTLLSLHNVHYFVGLIERARSAIAAGTFNVELTRAASLR